jgi:hypothetical protein
MDPIIIVPVALAVAWAATRKKKTTKKTEPLPTVLDEPTEPTEPPVHDDPFGPYDGPGGDEPWRPGGPDLPKPPGQVGPKPFPGPSGGPKPPEVEDPAPIEIYPGTTPEDIEAHEHAGYGLFISSDCETVYEGELWYSDVFLPKARELVLEYPDAFHHPTAVIYELLVIAAHEAALFEQSMTPHLTDTPETPTQACVAAWEEFVYGDYTPAGTYSGWISERSDPNGEYGDYSNWFREEYGALSSFLWGLYTSLWREPELAEVFDLPWPADEDPGEIDFDTAGS